MSGFGGMITFYMKGGMDAARNMLERVKVFALAESLGGVESLIEHPAIMTHASVPPEIRQELGIDDGLVRLSVGIEDIQDLLGSRASSRLTINSRFSSYWIPIFRSGQVAQSVEQRTENPRVGGSNPSLTTIFKRGGHNEIIFYHRPSLILYVVGCTSR
jgi:hypothetical protein